MSRQLISFDWAIKKLLRSKANFGILAGFLSELLFTDITIVEVLESESNKETANNKQNRVDIKVRDADGQLILIEIQYSREQDYLFRILFETSKCIAEHLDQGLTYENVAKVISVSILYFDFCKGNDYIYHGTTNFIGLHSQSELQLNEAQKKLFSTEKIADIFPEHYIINIKNFDDVATAPLDQWIYFLKNEVIKDSFKAKGLLEAKEALDIMKLSPSDKVAYDQHQKNLRHDASNYQSTYILGRLEEKDKIAINLINSKLMTDEQITQMTGLTVEQVAILRAVLDEDNNRLA
ncbi:MAG: Rpn family recombination-promoting nuclease/putative transposase [Algicola sp.]|nr:Rpn family recombination-promoting nuclease/putative transposase [Algicola sp.]